MRQARGVVQTQNLLRRDLEADSTLPDAVAKRIRTLFGESLTAEQVVDRVIAEVAVAGDKAAYEYTRLLDGTELSTLLVPSGKVQDALDKIPGNVLEALKVAAERVRSFHQSCMPSGWFDERTGLGQRFIPLEMVGIYVPGGTAVYPSTVIHTAIPAKVAGVPRLVMATPPRVDGTVDPVVLAAAALAGVDLVFTLGGAQAIAAMAYGTESVPKVDKIVGPGNAFVVLAKRRVFGSVGIDGLHGPTETMILADDSADVGLCAADLLAQAEHDSMAAPILVTTSQRLYDRLPREVERQIRGLEREQIAREALDRRGLLALVESVEEAIDVANTFAPEHLCLVLKDVTRYMDLIKNAGAIFVGQSSPEVFGDYTAGPSHSMPTGGTARFASSLGIHDFLKVVNVIGLPELETESCAEAAAVIATAEGLTAHSRAAEMRLKREPKAR